MKNLSYLVLFLFIAAGCKEPGTQNLENEIKAVENGLVKYIHVKGDSIKKYSIEERMKYYKVPGVSIAVVKDGKIRWAKGYGFANTDSGTLVDKNTLFQAGSISKPIAALAVLKLMEGGALDLDTDVNKYLKDWKVEETQFTENEKVTLRRLLTHTAGVTVHGFPGYLQIDTFPTITKVLDGKGNTPKIYVDTIPGSIWRYSGGGYTIMEKVVEDVTGLPLEKYLQENIIKPLGMTNSTYDQPLIEKYYDQASAAYDKEGKLIEGLWHNYPEQAAAGLWTTPTDLAKYCIAIQEMLSSNTKNILTKETLKQMLTKHKNDWGLGPSLAWDGDSLRFQHGGKNAGFTNNMIAFAHKGIAVIVMTNADNGWSLIEEILRSVSSFYGWGISEQKIVELTVIENKYLEKLIGKYVLNEKVPGIGDYFVNVTREDSKLVVLDPNNGERDELFALDTLKFIDLEDGDEVVFRNTKDTTSFLWNNRFQFYKVN